MEWCFYLKLNSANKNYELNLMHIFKTVHIVCCLIITWDGILSHRRCIERWLLFLQEKSMKRILRWLRLVLGFQQHFLESLMRELGFHFRSHSWKFYWTIRTAICFGWLKCTNFNYLYLKFPSGLMSKFWSLITAVWSLTSLLWRGMAKAQPTTTKRQTLKAQID